MPTQTFRTSKSFSTAFTHIARLRFKGNDDKQAEDMYCHPTTSGNSHPLEGGVFGGISSELKSKTPGILEVFSSISVPAPGSQLDQ